VARRRSEVDRNFPRFATLVAALLLMMLVLPFLSPQIAGVPRFRVLISCVVPAGIYAVSRNRRVLAGGVLLGVPAIVATWTRQFLDLPAAESLHLATGAAFLAYTAAVVLSSVLREDRVTLDTILGGISVYLLIGLVFVLLFALAEIDHPGSFAKAHVSLSQLHPEHHARFPILIYLSFVTITTVGYGDVTAESDVSQMLCSAEALVGQVYLAVFIARLVGLHVAHSRLER
jgi:hypothetical protein